jgi:hypothetical protein
MICMRKSLMCCECFRGEKSTGLFALSLCTVRPVLRTIPSLRGSNVQVTNTPTRSRCL